nr:hypothetical protein [Tanacetum cinerariifolium]
MEECHKLLTDKVDDALIRPALSISKMKAAYYPDVGFEQMVLDQMWIKEECKHDIAAIYGIFHWWFQIQRFYIDRHTSKGQDSKVNRMNPGLNTRFSTRKDVDRSKEFMFKDKEDLS